MKAAFGILPVLAVAIVLSDDPAHAADAKVSERIFELSPFVGTFLPDGNTNYKSASPFAGFRATLNNSPRWAFEGMVGYSPRQTQSYRSGLLQSYDAYDRGYFVIPDSLDGIPDSLGLTLLVPDGTAYANLRTKIQDRTSGSDLILVGGSIVAHLSEKFVRPFVSLGGGFIDDISGGSGENEPGSEFSHPFGELGFGVKLYRSTGWSLRVEARDVVTHQDDLARPDPRAALFAAIKDSPSAYVIPDAMIDGQIPFDPDLFTPLGGGGADGVLGTEPFDPDEHLGKRWLHNWAITASLSVPLGWVWKDADSDKIADRFDLEPTTAPNVIVDPSGRGLDSDGDRVFNGIDRCPDTPLGATVDLEGCPSDGDKDGVFDGLDLEPNTLAGAIVDVQGRSSDADGDGIPDGVDLCADTPKGTPIDEKGCSKNPFEERLLRGDRISMAGVGFEAGASEIDPLSYHALNKIGPVLQTWTTNAENPRRVELTVYPSLGEGGGRALAFSRADALRGYLLAQFPTIAPDRLIAVGASNSPSGASLSEGSRVEIHATP